MNSKIKDDNTDFLFQAILKLETMEECYRFFEDLCTVAEIKALSQRIVVAKCSVTSGFTAILWPRPVLPRQPSAGSTVR